ncbi:MAG: hypothetical protein IPM56_19100 [Ignavibacteriales bacterium]|nr:MAG: hypothetical protein IPM56_19100 [Ignavibacteriales bacterium]
MTSKLINSLAFLFLIIFSSCEKSPDTNEFVNDPDSIGLSSFLFVGIIGETPSLYKYDFETGKYKKFWYKPRENVIEYSVSPDFKKAFFFSALSIEEGGSLPLIRKVKLYLADLTTFEVKHIKNYGNVGQVITSWEDENTFKVILNSFDIIVATELNQTTQLYNSFGKLLIDESKTFDIIKDGFPSPLKNKKYFESPSGRFKVTPDDNKMTLVLNDLKTNQVDEFGSDSLFNHQVSFNPNEKFLIANFFSESDLMLSRSPEPVDTSSIIVYSLSNKKLQREWKGSGPKNFFAAGDYLVFDDGIKNTSSIIIYNLGEDKIVTTIKVNSGCGIKNIPGVTIYDVVD